MDLSMSTGSISALGILTNSTPIKGIPIVKDDGKQSAKKDEVKLIFLGTFFHDDSKALNADLIQIKEPTQIREIRVIPLGATVNLSTGSYQLGATNPSELDLEFYYNDLQVPSKSVFAKLQDFSFNDKCNIHLTVASEKQVITDGLIVRGVYSTITLAVYGFPVDEVPLKEPKIEQPVTDSVIDASVTVVAGMTSPMDLTTSPMTADSPKKSAGSSTEVVLVSPNTSEDNRSDVLPSKPIAATTTPTSESKRGLDEETPRKIPTITTRVKFDSAFPIVTRDEQLYAEEPIDRERDLGESDLSSDEHFESKPENIVKPQVQPIPAAPTTVLVLPEVEDVEDISDGEVFPEEEEEDVEDIITEKEPVEVSNTVEKTSTSPPAKDVLPTASPAIEPLSDQEDCLLDEFPEPGIEEIVSDEEMPDFPEYEYGEWEEQWTHIFGPSFNPFSESFQVSTLKNYKVSQSLGPVTKSAQEMLDLITMKTEEWSKSNFHNEKIEAWVQDMEELVPLIPRVFTAENDISKATGVIETLLHWATIGVDLDLAKAHASLPYKTRHIKVGIKLIHAFALCGENVIQQLLEHKVDEDVVEGGKLITQKLVEIFEEQYMSTTMRLSILRALDCLILTKEGFRTFVEEDDDENSSYSRLLEYSLDKNVGTRVAFSIRSFLKKVKLLEDLSTFEEFVLGIVKNSSAELSTSVEADDVDDCVHTLETLRDMAKNVDQYLSHPLRILPAGSLVELPPTSVTGHDPKISFIKSLEQYRFIKLCTVLVNNKDLYGRTGGLVSEIISILLEWESGLVYLSSEVESTTILLKTLAQLEDDGNSGALYACHCLEVIRCIDKLSESVVDHDCKAAGVLEDEKNEDIACLQTLVSFLATQMGRQALSCTLTIGDLIVPLLKCLKPTEDSRFKTLSDMDKTVRRGYSSRIIGFIVRNAENADFFMKHGIKIHEIVSEIEEDPEGLTGNLSDIVPFLRSALSPASFSLEGIHDLFNVIKSNQETLLRERTDKSNWGYPPEMISALRLISSHVVPSQSDDVRNCIAADVDDMLIKELKYEVALVKLHSLDAISTFVSILQKITDDFNGQPGTHCFTFVTGKGDALVNLLSPLLRILRRIISQVVQVRKTEFKDTTAIPVLLKVYSVIENIPSTAPCYRRSREIAQNIIGSLLAYTIPALRQGVESEEELNKSTWTAVVSEIIKYTMDEPATFLTGVSIFSELLPLPLPIASKIPLTEAECLENVKLRRLWSAYIHGLSSRIQEMIGVLCGSTHSRLIMLLKRLCVQLADLSASSCMVVCRAVLDAIQLSIESDMELQQQHQSDSQQQPAGTFANASQNLSIKVWLDQSKNPKLLSCSGNTARLLGFLSSLVNNSGTIKSGIMQALRGVLKLDEKYTDLITQFCCVLTNNSNSGLLSPLPPSHVQAQENIVTIFQSLCDQEINMIVPMYGFTGKIFDSKFVLANSLPPKDLFITICNAFIMYVCTTPYKLTDSRVMEGVLRGLEIISETEYGFYHMRSCIDKVSGLFKNILVTLSETDLTKSETFDAIWSCISSTVELLRSLTSPRHATGSNVTSRASVMTKQEFKNAVDWNGVYKTSDEDIQEETEAKTDATDKEDDAASQKNVTWSNPSHPLAKLSKVLARFLAKLNSNASTQTQVTIEVTEVENTTSMLTTVLEFLEEEKESGEASSETLLPSPDLLQELFSKRPVFVIVEKLGSENLPPFWLTSIPPAFDLDSDYTETDLVPCDLSELCQSYFPDIDMVKELERFYKSGDGATSTDKEDANMGVNDRAKVKLPIENPTHSVLVQLTTHRKPFGSHLRGGMRGGFGRGMSSGPGRGLDPFRSRPPNTSRPPSLHVDDFVALESSGQSGSVAAAYNKGGMRAGLDNFSPRGGRGNTRGSLLGRPYNDRGRFRAPQGGGSSYFGQRMDNQQSLMRRGSRGGIGKGYGNDQRWSSNGDGRDSTSPYTRQDHSGGRPMYDDKFRSSTPTRTLVPSGGNMGVRNQPYPQRNPYREAPPMGRNNSGPVGGNNNPPQRWRDRQRPFNR